MVRQIPHQFTWLSIELFNDFGEVFATALLSVAVAVERNEMDFAIA
jgi:hypothetical protein